MSASTSFWEYSEQAGRERDREPETRESEIKKQEPDWDETDAEQVAWAMMTPSPQLRQTDVNGSSARPSHVLGLLCFSNL